MSAALAFLVTRALIFATLVLQVCCLPGCSLLSKALDKPKVELAALDVAGVENGVVVLQIKLLVDNPNRVDLTLQSLRYQGSFNGKEMIIGENANKIKFAGHAQTPVTLELRVPAATLLHSALEFLSNRSHKYHIEGEAKISGFTLPFKKDGELDRDQILDKALKPAQ